jgi:dTDP-glucose 4,6-dehydratase
MARRIVVTGGLGFIGSEFVRRAAARGDAVVNIDLDTYAGDERRLAGVRSGAVTTVRADVSDRAAGDAIESARPDVVVHFAAETHVTRGESAGDVFYRSNVEGTRNVIEAAIAAGASMIVHVSTDEVYGPCPGDPFTEEDKLPGEGAATSAYARSKALADDVARSFFGRAPIVVVRPTNCFGPWQHPEKAIPRWTIRALEGERLPVWGDGRQVRDWMAVEDACAALELLIEREATGDVFNLGPQGAQRNNLEIARAIARAAGRDDDAVYLTEYDRPDHDRRYAIDATKLRAVGWAPAGVFEQDLERTVAWYAEHRAWWRSLVEDAEAIYSDAIERRSQ